MTDSNNVNPSVPPQSLPPIKTADPRLTDNRKRLADIAFVIALFLYVLGGVRLTPVHGDEYMQIAMARDVAYLQQGNWAKLIYNPAIEPDSEGNLRLINGTINKLLIGLTWQLNGHSLDKLPSIYVWDMPMDWNERQGNIPAFDQVVESRWPSAILTALGVIPIFMLGWTLRLRSVAYPAAILYALHPAILLNGRRAMMEGSMMFTTILTMAWLVAMIHAEHSETANGPMRKIPALLRYGILGVCIGLTVAAKHTGLPVAVATLVAALVAGLAHKNARANIVRPIALVIFSGVVGLIVWCALNIGYWKDPIGAMQYTLESRADLLEQQTKFANRNAGSFAYENFGQRIGALLTESFLRPPQYYESDTWVELVKDQITSYEATTFDGWSSNIPIGLILTVLSFIGLGALIYEALHKNKLAWAILIWAALVTATLLLVPLNWQRYYLPLILVDVVLAAYGFGRLAVRRTPVV
jgi:hypothetical protein